MKKSITILFVLLISSICFGQKSIDKIMEKFKVANIEVLGHKFSIGDTLSFTIGSLPNGDFLSTFISSDLSIMARLPPAHLTAYYTNYKFIIAKI